MSHSSSESIKRAERATKAWRARLLRWYELHGRKDLPWRTLGENPGQKPELDSELRHGLSQNLAQNLARSLSHIDEAYGVYVSEIMLQQTQVARVLRSYYFPFLASFPTLEALARASEAEVLKHWEGLGYYTRARNLHKAAKICLEKHGGRLPGSKEELLALPGIGAYTAGAILCFGFHKSVSFVDGNIRRVLSRAFALSEPKMRELEDLAEILLCPKQSFDYNQALLDVGALICTPRSPSCELCPLVKLCFGKHNPTLYPKAKPRSLVPLSLELVYCVDEKGRIALLRSQQRLYHGLYNLPQLIEMGLDSKKSRLELIGSFAHHYTKYAISVRVYELEAPSRLWEQGDKSIEFLTSKELAQKPLSSLCQKALRLCGVRLDTQKLRI